MNSGMKIMERRYGVDKLNLEEELMKINKMKRIMQELKIQYSDILRTRTIDNSLKSWFSARRTSLLRGNLEDEEVEFYKNNDFNFGIKLLLWKDWCNLLKEKITELDTRYIGENIVVDSVYRLGKWVRKQNQIWENLPNERKRLLLETGVEITYLYKDHSPLQFSIIYNNKKYENAMDFFWETGVPLDEIFTEINKWRMGNFKSLVKKYGGVIETEKEYMSNDDVVERHTPNKNITSSKNVSIESLLDSIDWKAVAEKQREERARQKENQLVIVKEKLREFCSEEEMNRFLQMISEEYKELIAKNNNYPVLSKFDNIKIKRMFAVNAYVAWEEEKEPVVQEDGYLYASYYSYAICTFNYGLRELKRISLEIKYGNDKDAMGGFYSEGEEYIHLSATEINSLLKTTLKKFAEKFKSYKNLNTYKKVFDILGEIESKGDVVGSKKADNMIRSFSKESFEWENDEGHNIAKVLSNNTIYIKKLKNISAADVPEIYMISNINTYRFEPFLSTKICIVYKRVCYIFENVWGTYKYEKNVAL